MREDTGPSHYSWLQISLHWSIAALVIFQLVVNGGMQNAFDDMMDGHGVEDFGWAILHIAVGITVLVLAAIRLAVRVHRGAPAPREDRPAIISFIGYLTHLMLYGLIFLVPLTGVLAWFGRSDLSAEFHELGRLFLIALIALHVAGAFAEHFVFRNDTLIRMLRPDGPSQLGTQSRRSRRARS